MATRVDYQAVAEHAVASIRALIETKRRDEPELYELAKNLAPAWYPYAQSVAFGLYGVTHEQGAGIVSAYSMREHWARNEINAKAFARTRRDMPGLKLRNDKARAIVTLPDATDFAAVLRVLNGPKLRRFAHNIMYEWSEEMTLDAWMARAGDFDQKLLGNEKGYAIIEAALCALADEMGYGGERHKEWQAFVWILIRGSAD